MLPRAVRRGQPLERPSGPRFDNAPEIDRRHTSGRSGFDP